MVQFLVANEVVVRGKERFSGCYERAFLSRLVYSLYPTLTSFTLPRKLEKASCSDNQIWKHDPSGEPGNLRRRGFLDDMLASPEGTFNDLSIYTNLCM